MDLASVAMGVVTAVVVAVVVALVLRRSSAVPAAGVEALQVEAEALRAEVQRGRVELERERAGRLAAELRLAASEERAARVPALEGQLREAAALESRVAELAARIAEKAEAERRLRDDLAAARAALEAGGAELARLQSELARLQEAARQDGEKIALLQDARAGLAEQFKVLAEEVMGRHGDAFKAQNREQLDALLVPLREQLQAFQGSLQASHVETAKERERLAEQVRHLVASSATMSEETRNLTQALKGDSRAQGAWGEMVLGRILELSGLRRGTEYVIQESHTAEGGARLRPDVVVNLPDDKRIVIDSKVSLTAFTALVGEGDPDLRAVHLARHVASMRAHVKELSRKEYPRAAGSDLDFVIMFVPIEGALSAALDGDPGLAGFAAENGVTLGTPTTLMIALRTVASVWQVERRNRNAEAIAERAGKLYDKLAGFVTDMRTLGNQIERVRGTFDGAMGKLSSGTGNVLRQAEMLRALGARTGKALPQDLLEPVEEDSADPGPVQAVLPGTAGVA